MLGISFLFMRQTGVCTSSFEVHSALSMWFASNAHSGIATRVFQLRHSLGKSSAKDSSDKFSYCPIRPKYWKAQIKRHFSALCHLPRVMSPSVLGLSKSDLLESRKRDYQTLSYAPAPGATGRAVELERKWKENADGSCLDMSLFMQPLQGIAVPR